MDQIKKEKNYKMVIGGDVRIIPEITLTLSKTGKGNYGLTNEELERISFLVLNDICSNNKPLTLKEVDFFNGLLDKLPKDFFNAFIKPQGVSYDEWIELKRQFGFSENEDSLLKRYYLNIAKTIRK